MKRSNKKGFTIVELVIVIAIIAILAAVLIPTFASLIQKANESKDTQLVKNLNTALAAGNKEHKTMTEALAAAAEFGYDVGKINASATGNEILWDSENDVFCYLKGENVEYIPETNLKSGSKPADYKLWKIYGENDEIPSTQKYSIYWNKTGATVPTLTVGFDAGTNSAITELTYNGSADEVVIRTNSYATTLTVNTDKNVVHYGEAGKINIQKVAMTSFHEYGNVRVIELAEGNLEVKSGANVTLLQAKAGTKVTNNGVLEAFVSKDVTVSGSQPTVVSKADVKDDTVAIIDDVAYSSLTTDNVKDKTVILLKDYTPTTALELNNTTVIGNMVKLKAVAKSGNVTLKNIHTTEIGVGEVETWEINNNSVTGNFGKDFTGTLTFDGGKIDNKTSGTNDFDAPLAIKSGEGTYIFKNMMLSTGATKGIKIKSAKAVVVENCVFDAKALKQGATGNEWETRSLSAIDIDITGSTCNMSVTIKGCSFSNIPFSNIDKHADCTAGAIKIKSQDKNHTFDSVVIENNTFVNCCRDIVIGKAGDSYYKLTFNASSSANWTVRNNTSTLTDDSIKDIEVKTGVDGTTKVGKMVGGCAVFDVADAYNDSDTYSVKFN